MIRRTRSRKKALRVNLSDLAAKGADPAGFLLALALPSEIGEDWLAGFTRGLGADAKAYGCPLLGGDTDQDTGSGHHFDRRDRLCAARQDGETHRREAGRRDRGHRHYR